MSLVYRILIISGITALVVSIGGGASSAQTPNFFCFMLTTSGNVINLEHICKINNDLELRSRRSVALTSIYTQIRQSLDTQDFKGAIDSYSQLLGYQPSNAIAYLNRGLVYWKVDNRQNAITDLQQASRLFYEQGDKTYFPATQQLIRQIQSEG